MSLALKKVILSAALLSLSILANGEEKKPDDYVEYRQAAFSAMGWHFKKMGAMIQGRMPYNAIDFKRRADAVFVLSQLPAEGFLAVTQEATRATRLKPDMWYQQERFAGYMQDLTKATAELAAQAGAEDKDDLRSVYGKAARTCKNCHDRFRANR